MIKYYVVKDDAAFDALSEALILQEADSLRACEHENVIKYYEHGLDFINSDGTLPQKVHFIVVEYLPGGTLFELCTENALDQSLICFIFIEIVRVVHFLNTKGYAHLDLKLENIMIDKDGKIKLIDFGFASRLQGVNGKLRTYGGTKNYMAPEIYRKVPYLGMYADVFAIGVVLFAMVARKFPFGVASNTDGYYVYIYKGYITEFWALVNNSMAVPLAENLKLLLTGLLINTPITRLSIPEIIQQNWVINTPKPSKLEAQTQIKALRNLH